MACAEEAALCVEALRWAAAVSHLRGYWAADSSYLEVAACQHVWAAVPLKLELEHYRVDPASVRLPDKSWLRLDESQAADRNGVHLLGEHLHLPEQGEMVQVAEQRAALPDCLDCLDMLVAEREHSQAEVDQTAGSAALEAEPAADSSDMEAHSVWHTARAETRQPCSGAGAGCIAAFVEEALVRSACRTGQFQADCIRQDLAFDLAAQHSLALGDTAAS